MQSVPVTAVWCSPFRAPQSGEFFQWPSCGADGGWRTREPQPAELCFGPTWEVQARRFETRSTVMQWLMILLYLDDGILGNFTFSSFQTYHNDLLSKRETKDFWEALHSQLADRGALSCCAQVGLHLKAHLHLTAVPLCSFLL